MMIFLKHKSQVRFCWLVAIAIITGICFTLISIPDQLIFTRNYYSNEHTIRISHKNSMTDLDSISIPLKRAGRLIMVEANVDGEVGNLIFDTGATGIVLNKTYFRDHISNNQLTSKGITGPMDHVDGVFINQLTISELNFTGLNANMANLAHIENRRGVKILGLFGFGLFRNFEIVIDIGKGRLFLYRVDKKGNRVHSKEEFKSDYTQKIKTFQNIVFLKGTIGGKSLWFCFDTGAETNAISAYASKEVLKTITISRKSNLNGMGSQSNAVLFGMMNDFRLGQIKLSDMETIITNLDHLNEVYDLKIDGMLGYNFLVKGEICINFEKNQFGICLTKAGEL
jgi:hypothetical protein